MNNSFILTKGIAVNETEHGQIKRLRQSVNTRTDSEGRKPLPRHKNRRNPKMTPRGETFCSGVGAEGAGELTERERDIHIYA